MPQTRSSPLARLTPEAVRRGIDRRAEVHAVRTAAGVPGLREAIDAMCIGCSYDPLAGLGTWRAQIAACEIRACPLWPYRPGVDVDNDYGPSYRPVTRAGLLADIRAACGDHSDHSADEVADGSPEDAAGDPDPSADGAARAGAD